MKILTREQIYQVDQEVLKQVQSLDSLINEVGLSLFRWFQNHIDDQKKILILIGPGNNGKDGLALAQHLRSATYKVTTLEAGQALPSWSTYDVIVDALFGIGLNKAIAGDYLEWIKEANSSQAQRIAIDIPSGLDCNNGTIYQDCFHANATLSIACGKPGLFLLPGKNEVGDVHIIQVAALQSMTEKTVDTIAALGDQESLLGKTKASPESHKYNRGKVGIILCKSYPGAALMSANAAQRAGAGYITLFAPESLLEKLQIEYPHFVFSSYKDEPSLLQNIVDSQCKSLVAGPGWDLTEFASHKILQVDRPVVLDGGLLTSELMNQLQGEQYVLTPHQGELNRLLGPGNKWDLSQGFMNKADGVLLSKGYDTLVSQKKQGQKLTVWNSPSLAMAGSGDILAGLIGAFLAQGLSPWQASLVAVDLHRKAGLKYPEKLTPQLLLSSLSEILNKH